MCDWNEKGWAQQEDTISLAGASEWVANFRTPASMFNLVYTDISVGQPIDADIWEF